MDVSMNWINISRSLIITTSICAFANHPSLHASDFEKSENPKKVTSDPSTWVDAVELDLSLNRFNAQGIIDLGNFLQTNSSVQKLDLTSHISMASSSLAITEHMSMIEEAVRAVSEGLTNNSTLKVLHICYNYMGDKAAQHLSTALKSNSTLEILKISCANIGEEGAAFMGQALKANSGLRTLDLSYNLLFKGASHIFDAFKQNSTLKNLNLSGNGITAVKEILSGGVLSENDLIGPLSLGGLTLLNLGGSGLSDRVVSALANNLRTNITLTSLNLGSNKIHYSGAWVLADAIKCNSTLKVLNLDFNNVLQGESRLELTNFLSEALSVNSSLTELGLASNRIGHDGAYLLGNLLTQNSTLQILRLNDNLIDGIKLGVQPNHQSVSLHSEALTEIEQTVFCYKFNQGNLTELDLSRNQLGNEQAQLFEKALLKNTRLQTLKLRDNRIAGEQIILLLTTAAEKNSTLTSLDVRDSSDDLEKNWARPNARERQREETLKKITFRKNLKVEY
jgi:Ran GTPase-activating protein (RanGAP) involved in mRNA processing and transport